MTPPRARGTMPASAARVSRRVAITCSWCMRTCPSSGVSQNRPLVPKPALLTSSSSSGADAIRASTRARSSSNVKSAASVSAPPNSRANCSNKSCRRATRISSKPSRAKRRANTAPIPLEAPVTRATRRVFCIGFQCTTRRIRKSLPNGRGSDWSRAAPIGATTQRECLLVGPPKKGVDLPADVPLNLDKEIQVGSSGGDLSELGRGRRGVRTADKRMVQQVERVQSHLERQACADFDVLAEAGIPLLVPGAAEPRGHEWPPYFRVRRRSTICCIRGLGFSRSTASNSASASCRSEEHTSELQYRQYLVC